VSKGESRQGAATGVVGFGFTVCALSLDLSNIALPDGVLVGGFAVGGCLMLVGGTRAAIRSIRRGRNPASKRTARSSTISELIALDCRRIAIVLDEFLVAAPTPAEPTLIGRALHRAAQGLTHREAAKAAHLSERGRVYTKYYERRALRVFDEAAPLLKLGNDFRQRVVRPTDEQLELLPEMFRRMADDLEALDRRTPRVDPSGSD
jgi:hypothetical protein